MTSTRTSPLLYGKNLLVAAGAIDLAVTAYALIARDKPVLVPMLVGGCLTVVLLTLGTLRHRGFLYGYGIWVAVGVVSNLFPPYEVVNAVVTSGLLTAGWLVALHLRREGTQVG